MKRFAVLGLIFFGWIAMAAAQDEPTTAAPATSGLELLDKAMQAKMSARRLSDLEVVVGLCREAIEEGLGPEDEQFARDLMTATLYEKAQEVIGPMIQGRQTPDWARRRRMAVDDLVEAVRNDPDHAESQLLLAQVELLPGGDLERGRKAGDRAIELLADNPARQSTALWVRSSYREDLKERLADLDLAIQRDPSNVDAWRDRGRVHLVSGETDEAVSDFLRLLEFDHDDAEAMDAIARAMAVQEKYDESLEFIQRLLDLRDDLAEPYALRASVRMMQDRPQDALPDLDRAIELEPDDPRNWLTRSQVLAALDRPQDGLRDIDRVLELRPGFVPALVQKAELYIKLEEFAQAAKTLHPILQANPNNAEWGLQVAALYVAAKQPRKAIDVYTQLIAANEESWLALRGRADAYLNTGQHAEAIRDYERAIELQPNESSILNNLSWVLSTSPQDSLRDGSKALKLAEMACEVTKYQQGHILSTLAAAYAELGDFDEAIEWSTKAVEKGDAAMREQLQAELDSYRAGKPWREKNVVEEEPETNVDLDINLDDLNLETAATPQADPAADDATPRIPRDP